MEERKEKAKGDQKALAEGCVSSRLSSGLVSACWLNPEINLLRATVKLEKASRITRYTGFVSLRGLAQASCTALSWHYQRVDFMYAGNHLLGYNQRGI